MNSSHLTGVHFTPPSRPATSPAVSQSPGRGSSNATPQSRLPADSAARNLPVARQLFIEPEPRPAQVAAGLQSPPNRPATDNRNAPPAPGRRQPQFFHPGLNEGSPPGRAMIPRPLEAPGAPRLGAPRP